MYPDAPVRQWVLSPPSELVPLWAVHPKVLTTFVRSFVDAVSAGWSSRMFTRLERFLQREGYLDPTEGDAPEALDRWWMRATKEPPVLPSRPRLVPAPGSELSRGLSIHAGVRIEGNDREGREQLCPKDCSNERACRAC